MEIVTFNTFYTRPSFLLPSQQAFFRNDSSKETPTIYFTKTLWNCKQSFQSPLVRVLSIRSWQVSLPTNPFKTYILRGRKKRGYIFRIVTIMTLSMILRVFWFVVHWFAKRNKKSLIIFYPRLAFCSSILLSLYLYWD